MTFLQATKIAKKTTAARFGLLLENGLGVWIYECKSETRYGSQLHLKCYRGCYWTSSKEKSLSKRKKAFESFKLAQELCSVDWKVSIISSEVLNCILAK